MQHVIRVAAGDGRIRSIVFRAPEEGGALGPWACIRWCRFLAGGGGSYMAGSARIAGRGPTEPTDPWRIVPAGEE